MADPTKTEMSRSELRELLHRVLRTDSRLNTFCADDFPAVYRHFANGMDRDAKVTLLFELAGPEEVLCALQRTHQAELEAEYAKRRAAAARERPLPVGEITGASAALSPRVRLGGNGRLPFHGGAMLPLLLPICVYTAAALLVLCLISGLWCLMTEIHVSVRTLLERLELLEPLLLLVSQNRAPTRSPDLQLRTISR